jgi:hypothetical protein
MDVEIHTTTGIWITYVHDRELANQESGAAARNVRDRIKAGEPIEVTAATGAGRQGGKHMAVFNPGHVVTVREMGRLRSAERPVPRSARP